MSPKKVSALIFLAALLTSAFTWPWDQKKQEPAEQDGAENLSGDIQEDTSPLPVSASIRQRKPEETDESRAESQDRQAGFLEKEKKTPAQLQKENKERERQRRLTTEAARRAAEQQKILRQTQDFGVLQIQRQVQETIRLNAMLQANNPRQAAEVLHLSEQVKNQQMLLRKPEIPVVQPIHWTAANAQEILRQDSIRRSQEVLRQQENARFLSQPIRQAQSTPTPRIEEVRRNSS